MSLHNSPRVSIGLAVYNGENFLKEALDSLLAQTFQDFELIISDNASTDRTESICRACAARSERVRYFRNPENIGASGNYTRVFELASGQYFKWAAHDDVCRPDYLARCVEVLDQDPSVVLCHSLTAGIDANGQQLKIWSPAPELESKTPHRRFRGALALGETFLVWGLMRADALRKTRLLGSFSGHDRPFLSGLSLLGRFAQVPEVLFLLREHRDQSTRVHDWRKPREAIVWYDPKKAGKVTFPACRLFTEHVLGIRRASLAWRESLRCYLQMGGWVRRHKRRLFHDLILAGEHVPGPWSSWLKQLDQTATGIESVIPPGDTFILVDEQALQIEILGNRKAVPFLEKDGLYWGRPADDDTAISELERQRRSGAHFIVFVRPALWWLDHYAEFHRYLRFQFRCLLRNDHLVVFDLQKESRESPMSDKG